MVLSSALLRYLNHLKNEEAKPWEKKVDEEKITNSFENCFWRETFSSPAQA